MIEQWKPIDGFDNYECSDLGQIRNKKTGRILKHNLGKTGYCMVSLRQDGQTKSRNVHSLIAKTWLVNDNPNLKTDVHHIDHDKQNNRVDNLKWVSRAENMYYGTSEDVVYANYLSREISKLIRQYKDNTNLSKAVPEILLFAEDCLITNSTYKNNVVEYR